MKPQNLRTLDWCIGQLALLSTWVVCAALLSVAIFGGLDVIATFLLGKPLPLARELPEVVLPTIVFLGASCAIRDRAHVRIDLFDRVFVKSGAALTIGLAHISLVIFFGAIAWFGWALALDAYSKSETANALIRFPVWPFKASMALAMSICVLEALRLLWTPATTAKELPK